MKRLLILVLAIILVFGISSQRIKDSKSRSQAQPQKLPLYVGRGYNSLVGNPKDERGSDLGFRTQIFEYSYERSTTTKDSKFCVPQEIILNEEPQCSLSTQDYIFRGSKSYQQSLQELFEAQPSPVDAFVFTESGSYSRINNETYDDKSTFTHSTAECSVYNLSLSSEPSKLPKISFYFISQVLSAYKHDDWTALIEEFGTHFVTSVKEGSAVTQEIEYDFEADSLLKPINIDIATASKALFAKQYRNQEFNYSHYLKEMGYASEFQMQNTSIVTGVEPSIGKHAVDWEIVSRNDPQPLSYQAALLSDLFGLINEQTEFDPKKATQEFQLGLLRYCKEHYCRAPNPEHAIGVVSVKVQNGTVYGSGETTPFYDHSVSPTLELKRVSGKAHTVLNNLQLTLSDGVSKYITKDIGGKGGQPFDWEVPKGEHISQVELRYGKVAVDSVTFITNKGNKSPTFGSNSGTYAMYSLPSGYRIVGFLGNHDNRIDKLGFVIAKTSISATGDSGISLEQI